MVTHRGQPVAESGIAASPVTPSETFWGAIGPEKLSKADSVDLKSAVLATAERSAVPPLAGGHASSKTATKKSHGASSSRANLQSC